MASSDAIKAGEGNIVLGMDLGPLANDLKSVQAKLQAWGQGVMAAGAGIGAIGAAITAPFIAGLSIFADMGADIVKTSRMTNMSFGEVQMAMAGTKLSAEELQTATKKMDSFIDSASKGAPEAKRVLQEMGLSISDLANISEYDRMLLFADGLQKIGDSALRNAAQVKIFGRSGLEANFVGGAAGVRKRAARGAEVGGFLTDADVELAKAYNISQKEMALATKGFWAQLGAAAAPLMMEYANAITNVIISARKWVEENRPLLTQIFAVGFGILKVGLVIGGLGAVIYGLGTAFGVLAYVVTSIGAVFAAVFSPVGLTIVGIAAAVFLVYMILQDFPAIGEAVGKAFSAWGPILQGFFATFMQTWGGVSDAIAGGNLGLAMEIACLGIELVWTKMIDYLKGAWAEFNYLLRAEFNTSLADIARLAGAYAVGGGAAAGSTLAGIVTRQPGETEREAADALDKQREEAKKRQQELQDKLDYAELEAYYTKLFAQRPVTPAPGIPGGDLLGHGTSSVGTFSASAIAGMIGGTDPIDKLRVVAEQQLDVQRDQLRAIENAFEWT